MYYAITDSEWNASLGDAGDAPLLSPQVKINNSNLAKLCTPPFLKLEKHAYCTTDLVILDRFCGLIKTELFDDLGRIYLRMMKMLHLCDYPMNELVCILAHASGYYESAYLAITSGSTGANVVHEKDPPTPSAASVASSPAPSEIKADMVHKKDTKGQVIQGSGAAGGGPPGPGGPGSSSSAVVSGEGRRRSDPLPGQAPPGSLARTMGKLEKANVITILCFLAHCYVQDECCPLRVWHNCLFKKYCNLKTLNSAVVRVLMLMNWKLRVPDINERFTFLMEQR